MDAVFRERVLNRRVDIRKDIAAGKGGYKEVPAGTTRVRYSDRNALPAPRTPNTASEAPEPKRLEAEKTHQKTPTTP